MDRIDIALWDALRESAWDTLLNGWLSRSAGFGPPMYTAKSRHSCQVRGRIVSPAQHSTARSPASRSKKSVAVGFSVQR